MDDQQLTLFTNTPYQLLAQKMLTGTVKMNKNKHFDELMRSIPNFSGKNYASFKDRYSALYARLSNTKDWARYEKNLKKIEAEYVKHHGKLW